MNPTTEQTVSFSSEDEIRLLAELLDVEKARLLVGTRHTFHREYRDELHRRLDLVDRLISRIGKSE